MKFGIDFNPSYAESLGLDARQVFGAILDELHPHFVRISAPWNKIEPEPGIFLFEEIDWLMHEAHQRGVKVLFALGQKVPRWPECYIPAWNTFTGEEFKKYVLQYIQAVVERYKDHPALNMWQVENEPFFVFGDCARFDIETLEPEIQLVKKLDPHHQILLTGSGEHGSWKKPGELGDLFGATVYRIVRDGHGKAKDYWYIPAFFYKMKAFLAGISKERFMIAELQCEPWIHEGSMKDLPVEILEETMTPIRLKKHLAFAKRIGVESVCLWGSEWWYFMKEKHGDSRYLNTIKEYLL